MPSELGLGHSDLAGPLEAARRRNNNRNILENPSLFMIVNHQDQHFLPFPAHGRVRNTILIESSARTDIVPFLFLSSFSKSALIVAISRRTQQRQTTSL